MSARERDPRSRTEGSARARDRAPATALWERVHAALDARRDPLADEAVLDALAAEPEAAPELARLLEGLERLPRSAHREHAPPPGPRTVRRPERVAASRRDPWSAFARLAAAVVVVSALAALLSRTARVEREPVAPAAAAVAADSTARIAGSAVAAGSTASAAGSVATAATPAARSRVLAWRVTLVIDGPAGREVRTADARGETRALDLHGDSAAPDGARVVALRASRHLHGARTP